MNERGDGLMKIEPRVTIALPVYNGENFIESAIHSILAQTYTDFEFIISDNASTDRTRDIVKIYQRQDSQIRLIENTRISVRRRITTLDFCRQRESISNGVRMMTRSIPGHVATLVAKLDSDPRLSLAFAKTICIDALGQKVPIADEEMPEILDLDPVARFMNAIINAGTCFPIFGFSVVRL